MELPNEFKNKSILIMDGPFMSIDPIGEKNIFIIGDVINTVHETYIGKLPKFNPKFLPLLDKGIIKNPILTNKELFLKYGVTCSRSDGNIEFFQAFSKALIVIISVSLPSGNVRGNVFVT